MSRHRNLSNETIIMKRLLYKYLLTCLFTPLFCSVLSVSAFAATEVVEVYFLPLQEAADAARSQLSDDGKVASMPSRRILIIDDDKAHLKKATALLKRLDHPPGQYTVFLNIETIQSAQSQLASATGSTMPDQLPGGWIRIALQSRAQDSANRQSFQLRISGNRPGSMETGTLRSFSRETRLWLSGYGLIQSTSVEIIPITSGFHITIQAVGANRVRVRIVPWMKRTVAQIQGQHEILLGLGTTNKPAMPPSNVGNMRLNAQPVLNDNPAIELAGAATELVIPVDKSVTIAAWNREAEKFGAALLSRYSSIGKRQLVIHLRISKN